MSQRDFERFLTSCIYDEHSGVLRPVGDSEAGSAELAGIVSSLLTEIGPCRVVALAWDSTLTGVDHREGMVCLVVKEDDGRYRIELRRYCTADFPGALGSWSRVALDWLTLRPIRAPAIEKVTHKVVVLAETIAGVSRARQEQINTVMRALELRRRADDEIEFAIGERWMLSIAPEKRLAFEAHIRAQETVAQFASLMDVLANLRGSEIKLLWPLLTEQLRRIGSSQKCP